MGGRGNSGNRNSTTKSFNPSSLVGGSVTALSRYTDTWTEGSKNIRQDFNLGFATDKQIEAIRDLFKGIQNHDKGYDEGRTPFNITDISIKRLIEESPEELARNKELFGRTMENKDIMISVRTEPVTNNSYIRMVDEKYRYAIMGKGGGFYTFNKNGKKTPINSFDMNYGIRRT